MDTTLSRDGARTGGALLAGARAFDVEFGATVSVEGSDDPRLLLVERGELGLFTGGREVAVLGRGAVFGLDLLLGDPMWPYEVRAVSPASMKAVDREGFEGLAGQALWSLERAAVATLSECLREVDRRIAAASDGFPVMYGADDTGLVARWIRRRNLQSVVGEVDVESALRATPAFADAPAVVLAGLVRDLHPVAIEPEHALFHEGAVAEYVYILVSGVVRVLKTTHDERVEELGSLEAGALIGVTAAVQKRPHGASCVADGPVIALAMDAARWGALCEGDVGGSSAVRRATVRALGDLFASACGRLLLVASRRRREIHEELAGALPEGADRSRRYFDQAFASDFSTLPFNGGRADR